MIDISKELDGFRFGRLKLTTDEMVELKTPVGKGQLLMPWDVQKALENYQENIHTITVDHLGSHACPALAGLIQNFKQQKFKNLKRLAFINMRNSFGTILITLSDFMKAWK